MKFDPKAGNSLIPDGEYDAEIATAEETLSKSGKDMMKLSLKVWAGGGGPRIVFDYLVVPETIWRLKQIAAAIGKLEQYNAGEIHTSDLKGASVRVSVKTQPDKTGKYEDRNVIARYLAAEAGTGPANGPPAGNENGAPIDDDIPF